MPFNNSNCHCEPFASCHSEGATCPPGLGRRERLKNLTQDKLREAIPLLLSEIAELVLSKTRKL